MTRTDPTHSLLQGRAYVPAAATDVTQTWRRFGWQPVNANAHARLYQQLQKSDSKRGGKQ